MQRRNAKNRTEIKRLLGSHLRWSAVARFPELPVPVAVLHHMGKPREAERLAYLLRGIPDPRDKRNWGPGPWQSEPDRVEFETLGYPCLIRRSDVTGSLCGYVAVSPDHPWHGRHYDHVNASVHGGLTYGAPCQEGSPICHKPKPGQSDDVYWFGFDCAHAWDLSPALAALTRGLGFPEFPRLRGMREDVYRDLGYVTDEVRSLAEQARLAELRCDVCEGEGWRPACKWVMPFNGEPYWERITKPEDISPALAAIHKWTQDGLVKRCLTCDGSGVSPRAELAAKRIADALSASEDPTRTPNDVDGRGHVSQLPR